MFTMFFWMISASKISHRLHPASVGSSGCGRSRCFFSGRPAHRQVGSTEGRKSDVGVGLKNDFETPPKNIIDYHGKYHGLSWMGVGCNDFSKNDGNGIQQNLVPSVIPSLEITRNRNDHQTCTVQFAICNQKKR